MVAAQLIHELGALRLPRKNEVARRLTGKLLPARATDQQVIGTFHFFQVDSGGCRQRRVASGGGAIGRDDRSMDIRERGGAVVFLGTAEERGRARHRLEARALWLGTGLMSSV